MAFFKFRQSNASPAKTSPRTAEAAANASTETVESLRRRARPAACASCGWATATST